MGGLDAVRPARIARGKARCGWDLPAGAAWLTCDSIGLHGVWINGTRVLRDDKVLPLQRRPGQLLREFAADAKLHQV